MNNALKAFAVIVGVALLWSSIIIVSNQMSMKPHVKLEAFKAKHAVKGVVRDKNRDIVRHGFLQHHIHDGSGNVLWQKPSDPELVVQEETE